jgi:undecaprenyl-diphosphatase
MSLLHAFLLGIIQGLTEFIPVSSTAHLLIGQVLLDIPSSDRIFSFQVIIQLGTVFALILFFWKDIWQITKAFILGIWHRKPIENHEAMLGWLVIVASIPALVVGFFLKDLVESMFRDPAYQAGTRLLTSAVILTLVEIFSKHGRNLESATWLDALIVGLFQILALFPGASRSGSTIAGGIVRGFDRPSAARFAFLMSGPIMLAAGAYEMLDVIRMPNLADFLPSLAVGFITAAIVGWLAIRWLLHYLSGHSLYVFSGYCAVIGAIVLFFHFML